MKIFPVVDLQSNWIPKVIFESFKQHSSLEFVDNVYSADMVWVMSYYLPELIPPRFPRLTQLMGRIGVALPNGREDRILSKKLVVTTIAHLYHPKEDLFIEKVRRADHFSDVIHFFSVVNIHANQHYFSKPIIHLPYWLDTTRFYPLDDAERTDIRTRTGIPQSKTVIGSFQRDTESDGETPKLEKGPDYFCDVVETLDPGQHLVLLAGPRRDYVEKRLEVYGMPYINLGFIPPEEVNNLYNALDYYLVTSRAEGGPQAILEAMATKTPIYSTEVGVSHLLDSRVVFEKPQDIAAALQHPYPDVTDMHFATIREYSPEKIIPRYEQAFTQLLKAYQTNPAALSKGAPSLDWFNVKNPASDSDM